VTTASRWALKALGYSFNDSSLLEQALTHKSKSARNNERLEFLGDAVLGMVIAEAVYQAQPAADEHFLTRWRSQLVRGETLAIIATELGVGKRIVLGQGEHRRPSILADALEALYGAVYLDGGYADATDVITRHYADRLLNVPPAELLKDAKTQLQEVLQGRGLALPVYELVEEQGPVHAPTFAVRCNVEALSIVTEGGGSGVRIAEQEAAERALQLIEEDGERAS
jgi:ribonuclease-3